MLAPDSLSVCWSVASFTGDSDWNVTHFLSNQIRAANNILWPFWLRQPHSALFFNFQMLSVFKSIINSWYDAWWTVEGLCNCNVMFTSTSIVILDCWISFTTEYWEQLNESSHSLRSLHAIKNWIIHNAVLTSVFNGFGLLLVLLLLLRCIRHSKKLRDVA